MTDSIVSYETAKLAKEKNFNWLVSDDKFYNSFGDIEYTYQGYTEGVDSRGRIAAPTQSLLQKWLREIQRNVITIEVYNDGDEWEQTEYTVRISEFKHFSTHDSFVQDGFVSYEDALEEGLKQALKMT